MSHASQGGSLFFRLSVCLLLVLAGTGYEIENKCKKVSLIYRSDVATDFDDPRQTVERRAKHESTVTHQPTLPIGPPWKKRDEQEL
jgi:hypothetical protein